MFTFDGWVTRVAFELHWALETRLHASALDSELIVLLSTNFSIAISEEKFLFRESRYPTKGKRGKARDGS